MLSEKYWTGDEFAPPGSGFAWFVDLDDGNVNVDITFNTFRIWAVRRPDL